ncbi:MAG TPA: peptidoglycan-binding domain-containing protein [Candidatus Paceibacterota bacterium]|nr:peptidoglycan-binding domain-containing protein [Candidatus Paceibacterota bacterium]
MIKRFFTVFGAGIPSLLFLAAAMPVFAATTIQSVKLTGPNALTVIYSQPVYTSAGDYTNLTGSFSGYNVTSVSGSGSSVIVLTLSGSPVSANATGYITVGTGVQDVSDGQYFTGSTWNISDSRQPTINSFSISSNAADGTFSGTNDTISISFGTNMPITNPSITVAGHSISVNGSGEGPYSATYVMQGSDVQQTVPVTIVITDSSGNQNRSNFTFSNGVVSVPVITAINSSANTPGILNIGDTISFTLTLSSPQPNAQVNGSYNGMPLSWSTANGGLTYNAVYTVQSGNQSQYSPLQITGVTLTDQYGRVSAPASGYDIQKTINTGNQNPTLTQISPVPSTVATPTPTYSFNSNEGGMIQYGGGCIGQTSAAVAGTNVITFNPLANGTYSSCTVAIVDNLSRMSNTLYIPAFTVAASGTSGTATPPASDTTSQLQALQQQLSQLQSQLGNSGSNNSAAAASYVFSKFLGIESRGADVTALQQRLSKDGFYSGPVTGYYGSLTAAAVKLYQGAHGITKAGYVGPGTREALNSGK